MALGFLFLMQQFFRHESQFLVALPYREVYEEHTLLFPHGWKQSACLASNAGSRVCPYVTS